jgi:hypothetical protein
MGGNPAFRGTRVPVHLLAELVPSRVCARTRRRTGSVPRATGVIGGTDCDRAGLYACALKRYRKEKRLLREESSSTRAAQRGCALRHHAEGIFMLVIWTGKPAFMFASTEVVVPVVHRRGGACGLPGRPPGRVPYLLQPAFAYGKSSTAVSYG